MSEVLGTWQRGEIALRQALGRRHLLGTFSLRTDLPSISSSTRACARVQYAACRSCDLHLAGLILRIV
jgi:hypothetical protein